MKIECSTCKSKFDVNSEHSMYQCPYCGFIGKIAEASLPDLLRIRIPTREEIITQKVNELAPYILMGLFSNPDRKVDLEKAINTCENLAIALVNYKYEGKK